MWRKALDVVYWLGAGLYFGGVVALGAVVAPAVFDTTAGSHMSMPGITSPPLSMDRQVGGEIFGYVLNRFAWVELIALALMMIGIGGWILAHKVVRRSTWVILVFWILVAALTAYDAGSLRPRVWELRETVRRRAASEPVATSTASWPEQQQFDVMHSRAEMVGRLKAYLLFGMILVTAWRGLAEKTSAKAAPGADAQ